MDNNNNIQDDDDDAVVQSLLLADGWQQSPDGPKGEWISPAEVKARRAIEFGFRFGFSIFLSAQIFDFLFNPIWMHGYLWYLLFLILCVLCIYYMYYVSILNISSILGLLTRLSASI